VTVDVHLPPDHRRAALEHEVLTGLVDPKGEKHTSPGWFYDEVGSELFDAITRLPEYYLTRAERSILTAHAAEIVDVAGCDTLVELGSGTSEKTRLLLDAMRDHGDLRGFVPFDISEATLRSAGEAIAAEYGIPVHAVAGDFHHHLHTIPTEGRRLVAFLGSTIGNLDRGQRRRLLFDLDATMTVHDRLLLGADTVTDPARLVAAYNDPQGVSEAFDKNLLGVLNREAGGHFDESTFDHVAAWNPVEERMEMRLRSRIEQTVAIDAYGVRVHFDEGESIFSEISTKFTFDGLAAELWDSGFIVEKSWTDGPGDFLLLLARPYC